MRWLNDTDCTGRFAYGANEDMSLFGARPNLGLMKILADRISYNGFQLLKLNMHRSRRFDHAVSTKKDVGFPYRYDFAINDVQVQSTCKAVSMYQAVRSKHFTLTLLPDPDPDPPY